MASFGLIDILGNTYSLSSVIVYGPDGKQKFPTGGGGSGTVTSVGFSAGTGISLSGTNPITTSGIITIINSAPDQTVVLTSGTGMSVTGTYPNFTLTNTAPDQVVALTAGTSIGVTGTYPNFTISNLAPDVTVVLNAGTGISVSGTYPNFTITNTSPSSGGTVTSVGLTAGTGISIGGTSPITGSGSFSVTNTAPDQTVVLNAGTGIGVTGTYPNFTIANSSPFTTPLTTKGDIYVRNSTVDTRLPVGLDTQVLLADSTTATGLKWGSNTTPPASGYYGAWQDNVTQTAAASNVGYAMIFRTVDLSNGVTVVTNGTNLTRITFANTGIYNLQFSSQFQNTDNAQHDVTIWLRLNGSDVAGSSGFISIPARKSAGAGNEGHLITGWNYVLSVVAGQYYEIMWSTDDSTHITMQYYAAGSPPPSTASVIMTVTQQAGIMAGTGITAINSLTGAAQTLTTGTTGTDFAIVDSGSDHKFNLPDASATARGVITTGAQTLAGAKTFSTAPILSSLTSSQLLALDGSGNIQSLAVATYPSLTELSYIKGLTSAVQTQIDSKVPSTRTITINGVTQDLSANRTFSVATVSAPFKSNTTIAHTGTTSETTIYTALIPAGTFAANDFLYYWMKLGQTPFNANLKDFRVYFNTSATHVGGTIVALFSMNTSVMQYIPFNRRIIFQNSLSSQRILTYGTGTGTLSYMLEDAYNTSAPSLTTAINFAVDQYIVVSCRLASAADTAYVHAIGSEIIR